MGLFFPDDPGYDLSIRQSGFARYRQLLSLYGGGWWKGNLLALAGALPLAAGITYAVLSSSLLVLLPCSLVGGAIFGPFLAGLFDAVLRGMRDDGQHWWKSWRRSWRQNWRGSLISGALTGLALGVFVFMGMLFWWAQVPPGLGTVLLWLLSGLVVTVIGLLYWAQLVLFEQTVRARLQNILFFCAKYLWRALGAGALQLLYWAVVVLFAPWTLLLLPVTGLWFILFVSLFLLYPPLDRELQIEQRFRQAGFVPQVEIPEEDGADSGEV